MTDGYSATGHNNNMESEIHGINSMDEET